jgi:hypothetical protein
MALIIVAAVLAIYITLKDLFLSKCQNDRQKNWVNSFFLIAAVVGGGIGVKSSIDQDKSNKALSDTTSIIKNRIAQIADTANKIFNNAQAAIALTYDLQLKADALNRDLQKVVNAKDYLLEQYQAVNDKLKKQIDIEKQLLNERVPKLEQPGADIKWQTKDSIEYSLMVPIINIGHRASRITKFKAILTFYDKNNNMVRLVRFNNLKEETQLPPFTEGGFAGSITSHIIENLPAVRSISAYAFLVIEVEYHDPLNNEPIHEYFTRMWTQYKMTFSGVLEGYEDKAKECRETYLK